MTVEIISMAKYTYIFESGPDFSSIELKPILRQRMR